MLDVIGLRREQCKPIPPLVENKQDDAKGQGPGQGPVQVEPPVENKQAAKVPGQPAKVQQLPFPACDLSAHGHVLSATLTGPGDSLASSCELSPSLTELNVWRMSVNSSDSVGSLLAAVEHMPRLKKLTLDLSHFTDADAKRLLRVCPKRMELVQVAPRNVPACLEVLHIAKRLLMYCGHVSASDVAVLAKCPRLSGVVVRFNAGGPVSFAGMHDVACRLVRANIPVMKLELDGFSDCKLVDQFKRTLRYLTISNDDSAIVDLSLFQPRSMLAKGLVSLRLAWCKLDANSCQLLVKARIREVLLQDCEFAGRDGIFQPVNRSKAETVLAPLLCKWVFSPSLMISCTAPPQRRRSATVVVE